MCTIKMTALGCFHPPKRLCSIFFSQKFTSIYQHGLTEESVTQNCEITQAHRKNGDPHHFRQFRKPFLSNSQSRQSWGLTLFLRCDNKNNPYPNFCVRIPCTHILPDKSSDHYTHFLSHTACG